jgi:hypothetical protein
MQVFALPHLLTHQGLLPSLNTSSFTFLPCHSDKIYTSSYILYTSFMFSFSFLLPTSSSLLPISSHDSPSWTGEEENGRDEAPYPSPDQRLMMMHAISSCARTAVVHHTMQRISWVNGRSGISQSLHFTLLPSIQFFCSYCRISQYLAGFVR